VVELENWFYIYNNWSFTKHHLWNQCKRAYYYNYICPALKAPVNIDISEIKKLKKDLTSRSALMGLLVHEVIEQQISQHYLFGRIDERILKEQYSQRLEQYKRNPVEKITEYFNGEDVENAYFDQLLSNGLDQITTFTKIIWPQIRDLEYLQHEKFDRFEVAGVGITVKLDYAGKTDDGKLLLLDWKTGSRTDGNDNEIQIGSYALWAMEKYEYNPEKIRCGLVYLSKGIIKPYVFSMEQLVEIKQKILESSEEMNRNYDIIYFPPNPSPNKCLSCQYSTVCSHTIAKQKSFVKDKYAEFASSCPNFKYSNVHFWGGCNSYDAIQCCEKALDLVPLGNYSEALAYFDKALAFVPEYKKAWYFKGLLLKLMDRQTEADYVFNDVAKKLDFSEMANFNDLEQCLQALWHLDKGELSDKNVQIRWVATEILRELKYAKAVGPLIRSLQNDENDSVRCRAADALGRIRDPQAVEPLILALKDEALDVRACAAIALARIGEIRALPHLIPLLADKEYHVRREVAEAIGQIRSPHAIEPLINRLRDKDVEARRGVAGALWHIAAGYAADKELNETKVMQSLIRMLNDDDKYVRYNIYMCLANTHIEDKRAIDSFHSYLSRNKGCELLKDSKYNDAIDCFDSAIKLEPSSVVSWYHKGIALGRLSRIEEALRCFDKAIELMPSYAEAWAGKGSMLFVQIIYKKPPENSDGKLLRSFASFQRFGYNEAQRYIDKAIELKPSLAGAWLTKYNILQALKHDVEAKAAFSKYCEELCGGESLNCSTHLLLLAPEGNWFEPY